MKFLSLLSLPFLLAACSGSGAVCDSGEVCDSGLSGDGILIQSWAGGCEGTECYWDVSANGQIGTVELELIETGDPSFDCGQATEGQLVCGVWTEYHTNFQLAGSDDAGNEIKTISLGLVDDYSDQINNQSTLFDNGLIGSTVTYMFVITDATGTQTDCIVDGHDPSFYASACPNLF
jgi:hypothetical protein